ncbi:MAG: glycosyltransferase family 2 protein [Candidatus Omnitrophica bacterium]|jgi:glycosyltransferase involved in cell wall biosynthesis|nr:glycosyltransferase family 2 protein [Candidatus Omnitrophota bacterium]
MPTTKNSKVVIVMPAYNAEKTLLATYNAIPPHSYDEIVLVDDASKDLTCELAQSLHVHLIKHPVNKGYGANQKTCYRKALDLGADIIIMLHPDNQYDPRLIPNIALPIKEGQADVVLASRFIRDPYDGGPLKGGMPFYKIIANRILTWFQNMCMGTYFNEFHTGYRAFSREALESVKWWLNSDDFVFDNEIIAQMVVKRLIFKEIPVVTKYFKEASSINFARSVKYGLGVLKTSIKYVLHTRNIRRYEQFQ